MAEIVDQSQLLSTIGVGFGEFNGVRYRGMGFIPSLASLTAIEWHVTSTPSNRRKVYIDTADSNSIPDHAVGSELYSYIIPNADLSASMKKYPLPVEQTLTIGAQYCFYIAPWDSSSDAYANDYRDYRWYQGNPYSGGKPIVYAGGWSVSDGGNLDMKFQTYGNEAVAETYQPQVMMFA